MLWRRNAAIWPSRYALRSGLRPRVLISSHQLGLIPSSDEQSALTDPQHLEQRRAEEERARYDQAVVDLLDVIGPFTHLSGLFSPLITCHLSRSRGFHSFDAL
jgi:hypothetical protein